MSIVPAPHPITVVLVDDHVMFVQSMARLLADQPGISVVGLSDTGTGALEAVRRHEPDVVLLDQQLPDGRGTDVAVRILAQLPRTKVVMLTASEDEDVLLAAIQAGCAGYVTKLHPIDEVVSAVRAAHAGEAVMPPAMLARLLPRVGRNEGDSRAKLSKRELEVLTLMADGLTNGAIGERLYVSTYTARNHVQNILTKLEAHSKLEAVSLAVRQGIIRYPLP